MVIAELESHLSGTLSQFSLVDVLQFLGVTRRNGKLGIHRMRPLGLGSLHVQDGYLVDVRTEERQGLTALEELLGWEEGRFVFVPGEKPRQLAWEIPIPHALLEAERRRDELHRAMGQLPPLETVFRLDAGLTEGPSFSLEAWQVLTLVNGRRTLGGILQKAKDKVNAARVLGQLLEKGVITLRVPESEDAWQSLRPSPLAAIYVDGERAFPARLRANLLLKAIDGHKTLLELSQMLNLKVEDIQEDIAYLLELRWIRFSPSEERRWAKMKGDLL